MLSLFLCVNVDLHYLPQLRRVAVLQRGRGLSEETCDLMHCAWLHWTVVEHPLFAAEDDMLQRRQALDKQLCIFRGHAEFLHGFCGDAVCSVGADQLCVLIGKVFGLHVKFDLGSAQR